VSTRKLITVALVCGLAILAAGGVQLVLLSGRQKSASGALLAEGESARVGAVDATVVGHRLDGTRIDLQVRLTGPSSDPAGWALLARTGTLVPRVSTGPGCLGGGACDVVFDASGLDRTGLVAIFGQGDQRRSWLLAG